MSLDIGFGLFPTPRVPVFADPRTDNIQSRATLALAPGTVNLPSLAFNSPVILRNGQGFYQVDTSTVGYALGGTAALGLNNSGFLLPAAGKYQWSSTSSLTAAVDVSLSRVGAGQLGSDSDLRVTVAGKGLYIKQGSNARAGAGSVLVGGTVTVSNTSVAAGDIVVPVVTIPGGVQGILGFSISAGVSFTVTSSSAADTSTFSWVLVGSA